MFPTPETVIGKQVAVVAEPGIVPPEPEKVCAKSAETPTKANRSRSNFFMSQ